MAISRVEIRNFLVFKDEFTADFCPGINMIIGGNATGKTTLMKILYAGINIADSERLWGGVTIYDVGEYFNTELKKKVFADGHANNYDVLIFDLKTPMETAEEVGFKTDEDYFEKLFSFTPEIRIQNCGETAIYIPVMEMLSISKGLLALYHDRDISFAKTEIDILAKAEKGKTKEITNNAVNAINILSEHIGGEVVFDSKTFFVDKKDGTRIPFSLEASGFRKFGLLWILLRNGLLEKDTTLFWDEPENSLNPELIPVLVELLLELSRNGVQIFIATHSELLASYFDALSKDTDQLSFFSLYKDDGQIKYDQSTRFDLLVPNNLTAEQARLYEKEIAKGLGNGKR